MPKYHVHVYPIVRVEVRDVEADSQEEACRKAEQIFNGLFNNDARMGRIRPVTCVEYADDLDGFLVDEDGDTEHERSTWYDDNYKPL
jgi:hypothetical protein